MFDSYINKPNNTIDDTEQIDDQFYAKVMDELAVGYKEKALVGKAIAQSDGNEAKYNSIYVKLRAKALQDEAIRQLVQERTRKDREEEQKEMRREEEQKKLQKKRAISIPISTIALRHQDGYFHRLFKDEIRQNGFTSSCSWYGKNILKKDGMEYRTRIDYDNMNFLIVDKRGNVIHRFHFEVQ